MSDDDKTGYGKPPKKHQFKPGQSGNPKGRPKKVSKSYLYARISEEAFRKAILSQLNEPITISENGENYSIPRIDAVIKTLTNKALQGHIPAIKELLKWADSTSKGEDKMIMSLFETTSNFEEHRIKSMGAPGSFQHIHERLNYFIKKMHLRRLDGEDKVPYEEGEPILDEDWNYFMTQYNQLKKGNIEEVKWPPLYPSDIMIAKTRKEIKADIEQSSTEEDKKTQSTE